MKKFIIALLFLFGCGRTPDSLYETVTVNGERKTVVWSLGRLSCPHSVIHAYQSDENPPRYMSSELSKITTHDNCAFVSLITQQVDAK